MLRAVFVPWCTCVCPTMHLCFSHNAPVLKGRARAHSRQLQLRVMMPQTGWQDKYLCKTWKCVFYLSKSNIRHKPLESKSKLTCEASFLLSNSSPTHSNPGTLLLWVFLSPMLSSIYITVWLDTLHTLSLQVELNGGVVPSATSSFLGEGVVYWW